MDPLSIAASIIGVLTFTIQVGNTIDTFISDYRIADSELKAIVEEVHALRGVLECLQNVYLTVTTYNAETGSSQRIKWKKIPTGGHMYLNTKSRGDTDKALKNTLQGLDTNMKTLEDVVHKCNQRIARGGVYKAYVQALWQRTASGIEKVGCSCENQVSMLICRYANRCLATN